MSDESVICSCKRSVWDGEWWLFFYAEEDEMTTEVTMVERDGIQNGYCTSCGDRLNQDGTATQMTPVVAAEAVRETLFFRELTSAFLSVEALEALQVLGLLTATHPKQDLLRWYEYTVEGRTILQALQAAPEPAGVERSPEAEARLEQYEALAETLTVAGRGGRDAGAEEVTLDIDGFCEIAEHIAALVADLRRLYELGITTAAQTPPTGDPHAPADPAADRRTVAYHEPRAKVD